MVYRTRAKAATIKKDTTGTEKDTTGTTRKPRANKKATGVPRANKKATGVPRANKKATGITYKPITKRKTRAQNPKDATDIFSDPHRVFFNPPEKYYESAKNQLKGYTRHGLDIEADKSKYMFMIIDTVHDIFDRESTLANDTEINKHKPLLVELGIFSNQKKQEEKHNNFVQNVYFDTLKSKFSKLTFKHTVPFVFPEHLQTKNELLFERPKTGIDGRWEDTTFKANTFHQYWSKYLLSYDLDTEKHLLFCEYIDKEMKNFDPSWTSKSKKINSSSWGWDTQQKKLIIEKFAKIIQNSSTKSINQVNGALIEFLNGSNQDITGFIYKYFKDKSKMTFIPSFKKLDDVKKTVIKSVRTMIRNHYTCHEARTGGQYTSTSFLNDVKKTGEITRIIEEYDQLRLAIDATKGSVMETAVGQKESLKKKGLVLTPAILLDSAITPEEPFYTFLLVDCKITYLNNNKNTLVINFNPDTIKSQQITGTFQIKMYVTRIQHETNRNSNYLFDQLVPFVDQGENTRVIKDVKMNNIKQTVIMMAWMKPVNNGLIFPGSQLLVIDLLNKYKNAIFDSELDTETKRTDFFDKQKIENKCDVVLHKKHKFAGMELKECILEIVHWNTKYFKSSVLNNFKNRNLVRFTAVKYFLDWKRMGDMFQIDYLLAYNNWQNKKSVPLRTQINRGFPYVYFTSQDILAICSATGMLTDNIDNRNTGLSIVFNTGSSSSWNICTNTQLTFHNKYFQDKTIKIEKMKKKKKKKQPKRYHLNPNKNNNNMNMNMSNNNMSNNNMSNNNMSNNNMSNNNPQPQPQILKKKSWWSSLW
jgi:hypothetical protein